jgi:hypothetical protein
MAEREVCWTRQIELDLRRTVWRSAIRLGYDKLGAGLRKVIYTADLSETPDRQRLASWKHAWQPLHSEWDVVTFTLDNGCRLHCANHLPRSRLGVPDRRGHPDPMSVPRPVSVTRRHTPECRPMRRSVGIGVTGHGLSCLSRESASGRQKRGCY